MSYQGFFAAYYDRLNGDCDYEAICDFYEAAFQTFGLSPKLILDLGCGSGNITIPLAKRGYDMTGLDRSAEMLQIAMEKSKQAGCEDILYIQQDMTDFELYGTVEAAVCALDGLNYLTDKRELLRCMRLTSFFMEPGGLFLFDLSTPYKYEQILAENTFVYDMDDVYCVWQNHYEKRSGLCEFEITMFAGGQDGYTRYDELQQQRSYQKDEIEDLLKRAGFQPLGFFAGAEMKKPAKTAQRWFVAAKKVTDAGKWA